MSLVESRRPHLPAHQSDLRRLEISQGNNTHGPAAWPTTDTKRELTDDETAGLRRLADRIRLARQEAALDPNDALVWVEVRYDDILGLSAYALRRGMERLNDLGWIVKLHEHRFTLWNVIPDEHPDPIIQKYRFLELFAVRRRIVGCQTI